MRIHYLFSDKRVVKSAVIRFNGVKQDHCLLVDDTQGMIIRRTFEGNQIKGRETLYGDVVITLPPSVRGGPYTTPEKFKGVEMPVIAVDECEKSV